MRVLISAYACEPDSGSEPGVGWNWAVQAALHGHDVHVITRTNNRASLEGTLREHPIVGLTFHYYDLPAPVPSWKRRSGNLGLLAYYYLWQFGAWRVARRLHERLRFDLSHHVTFANDWMPSGVGWIGVPFIWGPVGGSTNVLPHGLREFIPPSARRYERTRHMLQWGLRSADPFVALTRGRARLILTFTREALQGIPLAHRRKARAIVHIGVSPSEPPSTTVEPGTNAILTIASGSRLVHWKGFDLLVEAFARHLRGTDGLAKLLITGDGPFRKQLEDLIARLDISDSVRLLGHLPSRADVYRVVGSADLYALPTLRDGPPVAILEAMAAGRPILCLDRAAAAEMVPIKAAFKIPVISRAQVVDDIARSLGWADTHRAELALMGREARKYALEHHDWRRIGRTIDAVYREVQGSRSADASGSP